MLYNDDRRSLYDYERWLSGRFQRSAAALSPEYLLKEVQKLNAHIATVDVHRMNKQLLHEYLLFLLSDDKIALLQQRADAPTLTAIVKALLQATAPLPFYYARAVLERLKLVPAQHPEILSAIEQALQRHIKENRWQHLFPWLALLLTLCLCIAMYFFAKR